MNPPKKERNDFLIADARFHPEKLLAELAQEHHISIQRVSQLLRTAGIRRKTGPKPKQPVAA